MRSSIIIRDGQRLSGSKLNYLKAYFDSQNEFAFCVNDEGDIEISTTEIVYIQDESPIGEEHA